jgi:hypothetical protein
MSVSDVLLAPWRIPVRVVHALDDLATLAERARRDPDPVEEVRVRLDALLLELAAVVGVAREIVAGGAELTDVARATVASAIHLDTTGRTIHEGGRDLLAAVERMDADTRELHAGGERLTAVTEQLEAHLRVFRGAMPRVLDGLDTVDQLEEAVETVAETVEPLQGAAERVGRVTQRFSRSS